MNTLRDEYINPLDVTIDDTKLFNLSSGTPVSDNLVDEIMQVETAGDKQSDEFKNNRVHSNNVKLIQDL